MVSLGVALQHSTEYSTVLLVQVQAALDVRRAFVAGSLVQVPFDMHYVVVWLVPPLLQIVL